MTVDYSTMPVCRLRSTLQTYRSLAAELQSARVVWRRRAQQLPTPVTRNAALVQQRWVEEKLAEYESRITEVIICLIRH